MTEALMCDHVAEPIEKRMRGNIQLAMREGDLYFSRRSSVWTTLRRIAAFLDEESEPYAVIGALALFHHGFRRYTENVNLLVRPGCAAKVDQGCPAFIRLYSHGQTFVDRETGVSVRLVAEGERPGGIEWRQIRFPDPRDVAELDDGIQFANLPALVSLKLAAGLGNRERSRDLCDIQELILIVCLTESLAQELHPDVCDAYISMVREIDAGAGPFLLLWEFEEPAIAPRSMEDLIAACGPGTTQLGEMQRDGIALYADRPYYKRFVILTTNNRVLARKYDMHHVSEYLLDD